MKIILSPAMSFNPNAKPSTDKPSSLDKTQDIISSLQKLSLEELQRLLACSEALAEINFERYLNFFEQEQYRACEYFDGVAFKALDAQSLGTSQLEVLNNTLYILSGLYGALKAFDGISAYRLELKTKLSIGTHKNLYEFWGESFYTTVSKDKPSSIINLASKEYSQALEPYLQDECFVTCTFKAQTPQKLKVCSVAAKRARGLMARYIATHSISHWHNLAMFNWEGYSYSDAHSNPQGKRPELVFIKQA